jgi:ubiquinone/menaquinone biosynthesis C-methylase UbiE
MTWQNEYQQEGSAAELFQRYVVPRITSLWAKDLVDRACVQAGESVLDVACGTGVVTRLAAEQSGNGRVVGLDLNADMLRVARGVTHVGGISIEWYEGSALALPFKDGAFNIVLCQLGLQFFPDKYLALHEMARVLSFGGRLLLKCVHIYRADPGCVCFRERPRPASRRKRLYRKACRTLLLGFRALGATCC